MTPGEPPTMTNGYSCAGSTAHPSKCNQGARLDFEERLARSKALRVASLWLASSFGGVMRDELDQLREGFTLTTSHQVGLEAASGFWMMPADDDDDEDDEDFDDDDDDVDEDEDDDRDDDDEGYDEDDTADDNDDDDDDDDDDDMEDEDEPDDE
jgi:hypothetical protein